MKIVAFVKRVPDTEARIRIARAGAAVDTAGLKHVISPYDEFALEGALRLKDARPDVEVVVASLGEAAAEQLRAALAMGADRAILLRGESPADGLAVAKALAEVLRAESPELALFGVRSADQDGQQVGPMVAELMGLPCVTAVAEFEPVDSAVRAQRITNGGVAVFQARLPAVLTITKGPYEPRYASLRGIMAAKQKPLEEIEALLGEVRIRTISMASPPERPPATLLEGADAVPELVRRLRHEAGVL